MRQIGWLWEISLPEPPDQIHELTGRNIKTIRSHLHLYKDGGIEALKQRDPYRPKSKLEEHKQKSMFFYENV